MTARALDAFRLIDATRVRTQQALVAHRPLAVQIRTELGLRPAALLASP